jgi:hypothetical protein
VGEYEYGDAEEEEEGWGAFQAQFEGAAEIYIVQTITAGVWVAEDVSSASPDSSDECAAEW